MKKFTLKTYVISALIVLLIGGVVFALTRPDKTQPVVDTPKQVTTQEVQKTESSTPSTTPAQTPQIQDLPVISKPMLSMSSGNNAPVPAKASIEFSCTGTVNASCFVTLTNQNNPNDNLKFDAKTIRDDGHGNTSVTWIWEAKPGIWTAKATQTATGYQPNTSDSQTLTVNP